MKPFNKPKLKNTNQSLIARLSMHSKCKWDSEFMLIRIIKAALNTERETDRADPFTFRLYN